MNFSQVALSGMLRNEFGTAFAPRDTDRVRWCERVRKLESGSPFSFEFAPYQREPFEEIDNPDVDILILAMASRTGKTEILLNDMGYRILEDARRMIMAYPTNDQAQDFSKDNFTTQLVSQTPQLEQLFGEGGNRRMSTQTIHSKVFPGGKIDFAGLNVAGKMRKLKANWLGADEIDAIQDEATDEGDKLEILFKRGEEFQDTIKILASYPSLKGFSRIWSWLKKSDWRQWFVTHDCGHSYVLHREQLTWTPEQPETAELICPHCDDPISPKAWNELWRAGEWKPTIEGDTVVRGYQMNAMVWPHKHQSAFRNYFHQVAARIEAISTAENPERAKRVFVNTFDSEPYEPPLLEKPEPEDIFARREDYRTHPGKDSEEHWLPPGVERICAGVDPNKRFISINVIGFGANSETWSLIYRDIHGNIDDPATWAALDKFLTIRFYRSPGEDGKPRKPLPISMTFVDSRYKSHIVKAWTYRRQRRGVCAIVGSSQLARPLIGNRRRDPDTRAHYYELGTHEGKELLYTRLDLDRNLEPGADVPTGYCHFTTYRKAGFDYKFFEGLLSEDSVLKKGSDGKFYPFFDKIDSHARNEPLDTFVYAIAADRVLRKR